MARSARQHAPTSVRRRQLTQAAAQLFTEHGYHNVSMDDVAAALGLTGPALYRHFRNKSDILAQAISEQLGAVDAIAVSVAAEPDADRRRAMFLDQLADLVLGRTEVLLWKRERHQLSPAAQEQFEMMLHDVLQHTVQALGLGDGGVPGGAAELRAWSILGIYFAAGPARRRIDHAGVKRILLSMATAVLHCDLDGAVTTATTPTHDQRKPAGRRERLLSSATRLFHAQSYHAVSIEDIAAESDTAIATFYQYFSGKAELLQALLYRGAEGLHYVTNHRLPTANSAGEAVDVIACTLIELALGPHQPILAIRAADLTYLPEKAQETIRLSEREYVEEWVTAILGVRPNVAPPYARLLALASIGMVTDISQLPDVRSRPGIANELHRLVSSVLNA